jgi:NTE family protein
VTAFVLSGAASVGAAQAGMLHAPHERGIAPDALIPVHLVAFDLLTGTEVRLSSGPALEAVLAAAAIPGVLPPVRWDDRLLVDGGVALAA